MSQDGNKATFDGLDRRRTQRFDLHAPLTLLLGQRKVPALTRNVSNRGIFFYIGQDDAPSVDERFQFQIELAAEITLSGQCRILCDGRTVRTESTSWNETGVAAEIVDYLIYSGPDPSAA